ncbi:MAG TPA: molybdenum cofactor biosynthesis protein MoaE [Candidatus Polarisedimenticolaceae bacterium]|nr:molybdenum cofactor biosynthesis protein MoaE [Candidatus Polarisedimenticolaceae bacterium]
MSETGDIAQVTTEVLQTQRLMDAVRDDGCGAVAAFVGVVRNEHQGRSVHHLIYEAYPPMAEQEMLRITQEVRGRWAVRRVAIAHRIGRLEIGEASVVVAVGAAHRREALEACAFATEKIKERLPVWKKEFSDEGEEWIIGDPSR